MNREVRCPGCGRLLACEYDNGLLEIKIGRLDIWVERAILSCQKCGSEILVDSEGVDNPQNIRYSENGFNERTTP